MKWPSWRPGQADQAALERMCEDLRNLLLAIEGPAVDEHPYEPCLVPKQAPQKVPRQARKRSPSTHRQRRSETHQRRRAVLAAVFRRA